MPSRSHGILDNKSGDLSPGLILVLYPLGFVLYANVCACIARPYPTDYDSFIYGLLHGFFAPLSFTFNLVASEYEIAIYQTPNVGVWYDFAYLVGLGVFFAIASRVVRRLWSRWLGK